MTSGSQLHRRVVAILYGVVSHSLFVSAVGMMVVQMYSGMSFGQGGVASPWSWILNAALLLQFPLGHSLLLSRRGRRFLAYLAPDGLGQDLVPTSYATIAALQVLALFGLWNFSGTVWWTSNGATWITLTILYAASWLLLGKAIADAGMGLQTGWIGWWAVYKNARPSYPGMPERGLFRICRQPIYLAFACTLWTVPVWTPDQLMVAIALTSYCLIGPLFKEERFSRMFGQRFYRYQTSHPYFFPLPRRNAQPGNDLTIYSSYAEHWWDDSVRWLRLLHNLVPARLGFFDKHLRYQNKHILDLGCGGGFMAEALASRGAKVTGLDPSHEAIAIARGHARQKGLPIFYAVAAGEKLPLPDQSVDCVVSVDVLEHVADLGAVLDEIARVLRPGGIFAFDTINRSWLAKVVMIGLAEGILRLLPPGTHDSSKFIRPDELSLALTKRGFINIEIVGLGPRGINRNFDFVFGRLPFQAVQYMGTAQFGTSASA